jgi:hypothetical protein
VLDRFSDALAPAFATHLAGFGPTSMRPSNKAGARRSRAFPDALDLIRISAAKEERGGKAYAVHRRTSPIHQKIQAAFDPRR